MINSLSFLTISNTYQSVLDCEIMLINVASRALVIWDTCLKVLFGILM